MVDDYAGFDGGQEPVIVPPPQEIPDPDPHVVESARLRLTGRYVAPRDRPGLHPYAVPESGQLSPTAAEDSLLPPDPANDIRAVIAVINAASGRSPDQADALDVGAGLVLLRNLRVYLEGLETDLLDAIENVGLTWDVVAAIMGIPAAAAQQYHADLRARRHP